MEAVLAEEDAFEAFDSPGGGNPHSPWQAARRLAVPEAVPFLIECLSGKHRGQKWAVRALDWLGEAGRPASARLEALGEMFALWSVDEPRARALGVHLHPGTWRDYNRTARHAIARRAFEAGPAPARAHARELLASTDLDVVRFALDSLPSDSSCLYELAWTMPDDAPIEAIRPHVKASNIKVAAAAARLLMVLQRPEDAGAVIDVCAKVGLDRIDVRWLAPHPRSHLLYERLTIRQTFELVRRRRCANLPAELPGHLRSAERSLHDRDDRQYAPRLDAELEGRLLVRTSVDAADDRFMRLQLTDDDPDGGAYGHYARVLLDDPTQARAAFGCAWIDRMYGSPITTERVAWLRSLGVRDESLLADLAQPIASPLAGQRATIALGPGTQDEAFAHLSRVWDATAR